MFPILISLGRGLAGHWKIINQNFRFCLALLLELIRKQDIALFKRILGKCVSFDSLPVIMGFYSTNSLIRRVINIIY